MLNVLFPEGCASCKKKLLGSEKVLCTQCRHVLPLVCHHRTNNDGMKAVFYGRVPISNATALLQFNKKGITQELLHNLKYRGNEKISYFFGAWLGQELAEIEAYQAIDCIIPVPIHKHKKRKRGYNQVTGFGKEIATILKKPMLDDVLVKTLQTKSQVFKQRFTRFGSSEMFTVQRSEKIRSQHILLVDDIVTTGATLETCAAKLVEAGAREISLATIAIA